MYTGTLRSGYGPVHCTGTYRYCTNTLLNIANCMEQVLNTCTGRVRVPGTVLCIKVLSIYTGNTIVLLAMHRRLIKVSVKALCTSIYCTTMKDYRNAGLLDRYTTCTRTVRSPSVYTESHTSTLPVSYRYIQVF